jgi:hypothetical protein
MQTPCYNCFGTHDHVVSFSTSIHADTWDPIDAIGMDDEGLESNFGEMVCPQQPSRFEGYSCLCPIRSKPGVQGGKHMWRVLIEGSDLVYIGMARAGAHTDRNNAWFDNTGCWGCKVSSGDMFAAGEWHNQAEKEWTELPLEIKITLDCDEGDLSLAIGDLKLGRCDTLPRNEQLHLAIATGSSHCKVTILEHSNPN